MKKILLLFLSITITILLTSCNSFGGGATITFHNSEIDEVLKEDFNTINKRIVDSIIDDCPEVMLEMASDDIKKTSGTIKEFYSQLKNSKHKIDFKIMDEYYVKISKIGDYNITIETFQDDSFYVNNIKAVSDEMYVGLFTTDDKITGYLLTLIYIKENGNWKLYSVNCGDYTYQGLSAIDYFQKAKTLYDKEYKIPAYLYMNLGTKLLRPAVFLQYKKQSEFDEFYKKLCNDLNKSLIFPIEMNNVISNPGIWNFNSSNTIEGIVPIIIYKSNIGLSNEIGLKDEANEMKLSIDKLLPGISESFEYICFQAYSEYPKDPNKQYPNFGTVLRTKEK
ncbi:MAG: hypothetical protein CVU87_13810 [Firmicutes bacterium HGW-Firmicutes-12]|nr:MAG: hypothetical protein CVU87_13810 [Firmicutes bacterium HGW-Firmicutes-12]